MNVREAKDFLVDQAAQQAAIDGVPLSELRSTTPKNTSQKSQSLCDPLTLA